MGNAAGSAAVTQNKETRSLTPTGSARQAAGVNPPMPPEEELEERFSAALVSLKTRVQRRTMRHRNRKKECGICRTSLTNPCLCQARIVKQCAGAQRSVFTQRSPRLCWGRNATRTDPITGEKKTSLLFIQCRLLVWYGCSYLKRHLFGWKPETAG